MKYCSRCGAQNQDHAAVCHCCGRKLPPPGTGAFYPRGYHPPKDPRPDPAPQYHYNNNNYYQVPQRQPSSGLSLGMAKGFAIASMSCGILSLVFLATGIFAIILGICGLVFGALVKNAGYSRGYISGMSIAGLVCGIVGLALSLIWILACGSIWLWL